MYLRSEYLNMEKLTIAHIPTIYARSTRRISGYLNSWLPGFPVTSIPGGVASRARPLAAGVLAFRMSRSAKSGRVTSVTIIARSVIVCC